MKIVKYITLVLLICASTFAVQAEQKFTKGSWDIHYIAFPSTFVKPETASQYNLQRSRYMAVVNISVLDKDSQEAQFVNVSGKAKNLLGQTKQLTFTRVTEGKAVYYLAQLQYRNEEIFNFEIDIQQGNRSETIKFNKKFYAD
ncbi:DUF4426 domain-containing protein [Psychrosphaera ytuae]|uniref:DUF4426 domain-containing protein n=1 Tax=Psychrosphaera ytuae TaxID=2820710 RepID=A0A975DB79_9GAMM|nr:DUF4426 domain-containing protein [Psychrosphaera ytuae]QTH63952.1 DUF4426 domain-containing protein [Psychrosphaera ytuae]